jgi:hypothetical protein
MLFVGRRGRGGGGQDVVRHNMGRGYWLLQLRAYMVHYMVGGAGFNNVCPAPGSWGCPQSAAGRVTRRTCGGSGRVMTLQCTPVDCQAPPAQPVEGWPLAVWLHSIKV